MALLLATPVSAQDDSAMLSSYAEMLSLGSYVQVFHDPGG